MSDATATSNASGDALNSLFSGSLTGVLSGVAGSVAAAGDSLVTEDSPATKDSPDTECDLAIIGSGPAGYTAAIYAARAGFAPVVLAGALDAGGALMTTSLVENFPGFPEGIQGPDLMDAMREQAEKFGAQIRYEDVLEVDFSGSTANAATSLAGDSSTVAISAGISLTNVTSISSGRKLLKLYEGQVSARAVIVATGSSYRHLNVPGEEGFSGKGVSYCATCDGFFFRDKEILVVGGGDSAMEEALFLTRFASKVTVVHRRDQLRASTVMADRALNHPQIEFAWNSAISQILGDEQVTGAVLSDTVTGEQRELSCEGIFVAIGHNPRSQIFRGQLALDSEGYIEVKEASTRTNVAGVFACGDVVDRTYRQAISAAGSGCRAALDAQMWLEG